LAKQNGTLKIKPGYQKGKK